MLLKEFGNCNGNMAFLVKNTVIKNLLFDQKKALLPYPPRQRILTYRNNSGLKFAGSRLTYCEGLASVMCPSTNDSHVSDYVMSFT